MRPTRLSLVLLQFAGIAAAQETETEPGWGLLLVTAAVLAALAIYIYFRVQQHGILTALPQTAATEGEG